MEVTQEAQLIVLRTIYGPVMDRAAHVSRPGFVAFDHAVRAVDTALAAKEAELAAVKAREAKLRACLGFFASVIKSGEPWTATCEQRYRAALAGETPCER